MFQINQIISRNDKLRTLEPHLSGQFQKQQEILQRIKQLFMHHTSLSNSSNLALLYLEQISNICSEHEESQRFEIIRIYHKWLQFVLRFVFKFFKIFEQNYRLERTRSSQFSISIDVWI